MLLNKRFSFHRLMIGCALAFNVMPVMANTDGQTEVQSPAPVMSVSQARSELQSAVPSGVSLRYLPELSSLYAANHMEAMWQDREAVQAFQQQLAEVALSGVQPQFTQWVTWLTDPEINDMKRDIVLSDAMMGYMQFVSGVSATKGSWLYSSEPYKIAPPPSSLVNNWQLAVRDGHLKAFVESLAPSHPQYIRMHQALKGMLADSRPWPQLSASGPSLKPGARSQDIPALRDILTRTGMLTTHVQDVIAETPASEGKEPGAQEQGNAVAVAVSPAAAPVTDLTQERPAPEQRMLRAVTPAADAAKADAEPAQRMLQPTAAPVVSGSDNIYTPELVEAVKRFQQWQGLTPDGVIGNRTREWLNVSSQTRATLLALNIQRLRILPGEVNTGIMVNIPDYSLSYYLNGSEVLSSRVIVGSPARKTPLMSSELNNVVVNPPWNVPTKLIREDIVPKAKRDPSYIQRHNYTLFSSWSGDAQVVDPSMIDWSMVSAGNFPYRIRQAPGSGNSLGRYKFNMPNNDAIYLHDTPNHGLFEKDIRALSSGCVRVNKASTLANMLLQDAGWSNARVSSALKGGNTQYVPVRQRIPVRLYYLTAWVADDGKPQFRTDIYNYDNTVRSGAKVVAQAEQLFQL